MLQKMALIKVSTVCLGINNQNNNGRFSAISLNHYRLNRLPHTKRKMAKLFANSEDPDQMPHFALSDLVLHCLPITFLGVYRLQWIYGRQWVVAWGPFS